MSIVWEHSTRAGTELLMMLALADFSDDQGNSYPAVATLAEKCRMKPRNANYILSNLQEAGEILVMPNEGPKGVNRYRIAIERLTGVQQVAGAVRASESKAPAEKGGRAGRLPEGFAVSAAVRAWAESNGFAEYLDAHLEQFIGYAKAKGAKYLDWDQAFMNAIRGDWGDVRAKAARGKPAGRSNELSTEEVFT